MSCDTVLAKAAAAVVAGESEKVREWESGSGEREKES